MSLVAIVAAAGCYHYAPIPVPQLEPGMDVRARLTATAVDRLSRGSRTGIGALDGFTVSGTVGQIGSDSVLLSVPTTVLEAGYRATVLRQDIAVARADVVAAETQRLDKWRTGLIVGGVAAGTLAVIINTRRGAGHSGGIPVIGGPSETRAPVGFMWRLP
jgi:hypothetical protein